MRRKNYKISKLKVMARVVQFKWGEDKLCRL